MYQLKLVYRMIEYEGVAGTCLPHRDFGLLTLVQSTTSGLLVEREGRCLWMGTCFWPAGVSTS